MPINGLRLRLTGKSPKTVTCPRDRHSLSRRDIDPDALSVLYRLSNAGYTAYLVGGGVRDILLEKPPKDFDVATDAHPQQIRRLFRNCFLIGRRFRLAHIRFGEKIIETSTFRRSPDPEIEAPPRPGASHGRHYQHSDNTFGTPEEDALRRDFTVNGLFYDIKTFAIIDYVGGLTDLKQMVLRSIGDPDIRFREDPVRMLRAVRFAARLGFRIDRAATRALKTHAPEILQASPPRLFEEYLKLFTYQSAQPAIRLLWQTGLMSALLPVLDTYINSTGKAKSALWRYLEALDGESAPGPAVSLAALFFPLLQAAAAVPSDTRRKPTRSSHILPHQRFNASVAAPNVHFPIPRALLQKAGYLLDAQDLFTDETLSPGRRERHSRHPEFPEALQLRRICLKAEAGALSSLAPWQKLADQTAAAHTVAEAATPPTTEGDRPPRKRRPRGRKRPAR